VPQARLSLPRVSAELICRDWRHREGSENPAEIAEYGALEPNVLYYYHYTSDAPPEPLARFAALKTPVWNVEIYHDPALGWAIRAPKEDDRLSPPPGASCTVHLNGAPHRFEILEAVRRRVVGGRRTAAGGWEDTWRERPERLLHHPEDPAVLRDWLEAQFDVDAHMAAMQAHFLASHCSMRALQLSCRHWKSRSAIDCSLTAWEASSVPTSGIDQTITTARP